MKHLLKTSVVMLLLFLLNFISFVSGSNQQNIFTEDFESGHDGWKRTNGIIFFPKTQKSITHEGDYAFRMTGIGFQGYSGRFEHETEIPVTSNITLEFAYYFLRKQVSYVGYQVEFSDGKIGNYFSLFSGWFVNISVAYVVQYENESPRTWQFHRVNVYEDYRKAFGSAPLDLRITSISLMIGDPYYLFKFQTAYFDSIKIYQDEDIGVESISDVFKGDI